MLTRDELVKLYRELRHDDVLSVYLDGRIDDFSQRNLWRRHFEQQVGEIRRQLEDSSSNEKKAFEEALGYISREFRRFDNFLPSHGWVGFAGADGLFIAQSVRAPMPDLVRWEKGIRVAPYLRALKQDRVVVTVLVDSRRARLFEYRDGELGEPLGLVAETYLGDLTDTNMSRRPTNRSGIRGETGTDAARRLLEVGSERMLKHLTEEITARLGKDGILLVGGPGESVAAALAHLPQQFTNRTLELQPLGVEIPESQLRELIEQGASELTRRLQSTLVDEVIGQAHGGGRGSLGLEAVRKALEDCRVDTLLLSRSFIQTSSDLADHLVGAAFEQHAEVEELSSKAAEKLDSEGRGVAARLRYVL